MKGVYISGIFKGKLTFSDLLMSVGGLSYVFKKSDITDDGALFIVNHEKYQLISEYKNDIISLQRNGYRCELNLAELHADKIRIWIEWYNDFIILVARYGNEKDELVYQLVDTNPVKVPSDLIKAARAQQLIPTLKYSDESQFWNKIISCLNTIQYKIDASGAHSTFWNYAKKDNNKNIYKPKKETEIHPIIHSLLIDQSIIHSFNIIPEFKSGVGNLDFLIEGSLTNGKRCKVCIEFKNAHSSNFDNGYLFQLPAYMRNMEVDYGIYGILNFKGQWFNANSDLRTMTNNLIIKSKKIKDPLFESIRMICINLSKPVTASKIKNYS